MKLKKCSNCKAYNLEDNCKKCSKKTSDAHYKFREKFLGNKEIKSG